MCNNRIINSQTTYITSAYPDGSFYFANGILSGIVSNKCDLNAYKGLLKFDFTHVAKCNIESAFLYLYINDRKCIEDVYNSNLIITKNLEDFNIKKVNWYNQPKTNLNDPIKLIIRGENKRSYIKIDIKEFIDNEILEAGTLGFTIQGVAQCKTSLVNFASCNTINRPYIEIKYNSLCDDECYYEDDYEENCQCSDRFNCDYGYDNNCRYNEGKYNLGWRDIEYSCCSSILGPTGPTGALGPTGPRGIGLQGVIVFDYKDTAFYPKNQLVNYKGSTYITKVNSPQGYPNNSEDYSLIVEKGATGAIGATGDRGPTGVGLLGITIFNPNNSIAYTLGQVVTYEGSTYIVIMSPPQGTPENSTDYMLLAAKGATGATGIVKA